MGTKLSDLSAVDRTRLQLLLSHTMTAIAISFNLDTNGADVSMLVAMCDNDDDPIWVGCMTKESDTRMINLLEGARRNRPGYAATQDLRPQTSESTYEQEARRSEPGGEDHV